MKEVVMKVDDEFWDNITQLTVFKEQKEITHCKDCKYWEEFSCASPPFYYCARLQEYNVQASWVGFETDADDFCSRGERAE